jgi:hypothetical protein
VRDEGFAGLGFVEAGADLDGHAANMGRQARNGNEAGTSAVTAMSFGPVGGDVLGFFAPFLSSHSCNRRDHAMCSRSRAWATPLLAVPSIVPQSSPSVPTGAR